MKFKPFVKCFFFAVCLINTACNPNTGYVEEQPKKRRPISDSEMIRSGANKIIDTIADQNSLFVKADNGHICFFLKSIGRSYQKNDSTEYYSYALEFYKDNNKIPPFKGLLHRNYTHNGKPYNEVYTASDKYAKFKANKITNWVTFIPYVYFAGLPEGKQEIKLKLLRTVYFKNLEYLRDIDSINKRPKEWNFRTKRKDEFTYSIQLNIPAIYLKKIVVGSTEVNDALDRHDYGYTGNPDLFYTFEVINEEYGPVKEVYYRSETAEQKFKYKFKDTVYLMGMKLPNEISLHFWDEDVKFDDYLGGYEIDFTDENKNIDRKSVV